MLKDLDDLPSGRELHHWADYVELRCIAGEGGAFSASQLVHSMRSGEDLQQDEKAEQDGEEVTPDELLDFIADEVLDEREPQYEASDKSQAAKQDVDLLKAQDVFRLLEYRETAFGSAYPFTVVDGNDLKRTQTLDPAQSTYIYLLLCSSLSYMQRQTWSVLTTSFERFSFEAFKKCVPARATSHIFGTAAGAGARYTGNFYTKAKRLAADLRMKLIADEGWFSKYSSGDEGLDLVAWLELPDQSKALPVAFGQCTVKSDWRGKQEEVSEARWSQMLALTSPIQNMTFIPYCFHGVGGDWEVPHHVHKGVLIDRFRALYLLDAEIRTHMADVPYDVVSQVAG